MEKDEISPKIIKHAFKIFEEVGILYQDKGKIYFPYEGGWKLLQEYEKIKEEIEFFGHGKLLCINKQKIGITKLDFPKFDEDCFIGIKANKSSKELNEILKENLKKGCKVRVRIIYDSKKEEFSFFGSPALEMEDSENIIINKDTNIEKSTIGILSEKSSNDLSIDFVKEVKKGKKFKMEIETLKS